MKASLRFAPLLILLLIARCSAQVSIDGATTFSLATVEQGRAVLGADDLYIQNQTAWERGARMQISAEESAKDFLAFETQNVLPWTAADRRKLIPILESLVQPLSPYASLYPKNVLFVKTSGREEYGAAYTRSNAIMLKADIVSNTRPALLRQIVAHESFHVLSRYQPELRDRLYAAIGFEKCAPLIWPAAFERRRVTNPDAPVYEHAISIRWNGEPRQAMLTDLARDESFESEAGDEGLRFSQDRLLIVEPAPDGKHTQVVMKDGVPLAINPASAEGLFEKIGRNTAYMIHPEEIVADNYSLLIVRSAFIPSQDVLDRIKIVLLDGAAKARRAAHAAGSKAR